MPFTRSSNRHNSNSAGTMLFTETRFFVFFAAYLLLHFLVPIAQRIWLIIVGGLVFYAWWRPDYLWVPLALTLIAFYGAHWVVVAGDEHSRKWRLIATLVVLFLPLAVVKYTYFLLVHVLGLVINPATLLNPPELVKWALPLGISFISFTACAYVVDVYRGNFPVQQKLRHVLAHVLFFPHLIAGPILRPHELIPRLKAMRPARDARFMLGLSIFTLGLVKKVVFADQISATVEQVYGTASMSSSLDYITAFYGFAVQIYCDFSGYTDMAIGLALVIGMRLPNNFLRPYGAASITEFWRRWHITLSHWLRDYLYIPLGGNRYGTFAQTRNMLITMALGGLWHGANWTFVIWGLLHGLTLAMNHGLSRALGRGNALLPRWLAVVVTFHWVGALWVLFRAANMETALRVLSGPFAASWENLPQNLERNAFVLLLIVFFFLLHRFDRHAYLRIANRRMNPALQYVAIFVCWIVAIAVSQGSSAKFIYFDF
jgi:alginate O-acetyltransferase complex protein AlgI